MLILTAYLLASARASAIVHHKTSGPAPVFPPEEIIWTGYGGNAQHSATSNYSPSGYGAVYWSTPLDANPSYSGTTLYAHYGATSMTAQTIVVPNRNKKYNYEFDGRLISTGALEWSFISDYALPAQGGPNGWDWTPPVSGTLLPDGTYAGPRLGGGVFFRPHADRPGLAASSFYPCGDSAYADNYAVYSANVFIVTPITADSSGNVYYGVRVYGAVPNDMSNSFVKMSETGAVTLYPCESGRMPAMNAGPAMSPDGNTVYCVENSTSGSSESHIVALSTSSMSKSADVLLLDPFGNWLWALSDATSSPLVGPDGDVYYGGMFGYYDRGWLTHFDKNLNPKGVEGAFGWDDTPAIVPSSSVPAYSGSSSYLLCCKYNHYAGTGLSGNNMVALLDPNASSVDPYDGISTMKPVIEVLGVTPDPNNDQSYPGAVREWCINSAAVDVNGKTIVLNSEDGCVYKWDLTLNSSTSATPGALTGTLSAHLQLTDGIGEAYTPTSIAKDGTAFAVDNARIYAIRAAPQRHVVSPVVASLSRTKSGSAKR